MHAKTIKSSIWQLTLLVLCYALVFQHTIAELVKDWTINPNYSHGFLIPFIAGYMIWHRYGELAEIPIRPAWWGLLLVALAYGLSPIPPWVRQEGRQEHCVASLVT